MQDQVITTARADAKFLKRELELEDKLTPGEKLLKNSQISTQATQNEQVGHVEYKYGFMVSDILKSLEVLPGSRINLKFEVKNDKGKTVATKVKQEFTQGKMGINGIFTWDESQIHPADRSKDGQYSVDVTFAAIPTAQSWYKDIDGIRKPKNELTITQKGNTLKINEKRNTPVDNPEVLRINKMIYQGGSWFRTTGGLIQWAKGVKTRQDLYNKGIKGEYLGTSYNEYTGEGYITNYLPNGQTQKQFVGEIKKEEETLLKDWESAAKEGGLKNIIWTVTFDTVNGIYVFLRALAGAPDKSISGRGLSPKDKLESGLSGLQTVGMWTSSLGTLVKGLKATTKFQPYSKMTKGRFSTMGERWNGFRTDKGNVIIFQNYKEVSNDINLILPEIGRHIDSLSDTLKIR